MKPETHSLKAWDLYVLHRAWYWVWGGVASAARKVTFARIESLEFANSAALLCIGSWMLLVACTSSVDAVVFPRNADFMSLRIVAALTLIGVGRYGLHCMLSDKLEKRESGLLLTFTAWAPLALSALLFTDNLFITMVFFAAAFVAAVLYCIVNEHRENKTR